MTATATIQRKKEIASSLGMYNPVIIESNPDRPNIFLESKKRSSKGEDNLLAILEPLITELKAKRLDFPLTLIYGSLATISNCYSITSRMLGPLQYEPIGSCTVAANRMFTMFHAQYPDHERQRIVTELVAGTSIIRLLFVTVAFGIGIDVQNIRRVIHIGVPHTMEEFFQEAGRCGRDGLPASSTVYYNNHDISSSRKVCQEMIDYVLSDDVCKRKKILSHFGHSVPKSNMPAHLCCNVHAKTCDCDECLLAATSEMLENVSCADDQEKEIPSKSTAFDQAAPPQLSLEKKKLLRKKLIDFRQTLHGLGRSCVGSVSLCTGFSMELLEEVVGNANDFMSAEDINTKLPVFNTEHAVAIFKILNDIRCEKQPIGM